MLMVKADMEARLKVVLLSVEGARKDADIASGYGISVRTLRRWKSAYVNEGLSGLKPKSTAPHNRACINDALGQRIIRLKQKYPHWGARRIKYQFNIPVHWKTVHNVIKKHGLLIRVKAKPQPCRRFQRKHVDSMWQCDTFQFRISGVGKVYVTGFIDDCSRYRIRSKAYTRMGKEEAVNCLRWALRNGRKPREIYVDNGRQFISKLFKEEAAKHGIRLIFGAPYNARGRGKIESYHKTLHRELISLERFNGLSHFREKLWGFDQRYNNWRKHQELGWKTPASVYNDERYFNKDYKNKLRSGQMSLQ
jgi:transposase InsO family protein